VVSGRQYVHRQETIDTTVSLPHGDAHHRKSIVLFNTINTEAVYEIQVNSYIIFDDKQKISPYLFISCRRSWLTVSFVWDHNSMSSTWRPWFGKRTSRVRCLPRQALLRQKQICTKQDKNINVSLPKNKTHIYFWILFYVSTLIVTTKPNWHKVMNNCHSTSSILSRFVLKWLQQLNSWESFHSKLILVHHYADIVVLV